MSELNKIALKILSNGKGILAADESNGTMTKRLDSVNIQSSPENRLLFRETLFTSESMKECIGGVILFDETINQTSNYGKTIPAMISETGALSGIKVDTGAKDLANSPKEKITEGLDGLRDRLKKYYDLGARFTKWRGVYSIGEKYPSKLAISSNAHALARYSALVQEIEMVPIVEPEVLMDGNHSAEEDLSVGGEAPTWTNKSKEIPEEQLGHLHSDKDKDARCMGACGPLHAHLRECIFSKALRAMPGVIIVHRVALAGWRGWPFCRSEGSRAPSSGCRRTTRTRPRRRTTGWQGAHCSSTRRW